MIKVNKFRHIAIVVNDFDKMVDFYSKTLGFTVIREFDIASEDFRKGVGISDAKARGAHLSIPGNGVEIEMFEYNQKADRIKELSVANYPGFRHIAFFVENLEDTYKCLKETGIEFFSEPITVKEPQSVAGFRFIYFKDPEGNIIELNQLPEI